MRKINLAVVCIGLAFSAVSFADPSKVEITSFHYSGVRTSAAEVCGKLTGVTVFPAFVKILVDEKSKTPGTYNAVVGSDSVFCVTITTLQGTASVSLWNQNSPGVLTNAQPY